MRTSSISSALLNFFAFTAMGVDALEREQRALGLTPALENDVLLVRLKPGRRHAQPMLPDRQTQTGLPGWNADTGFSSTCSSAPSRRGLERQRRPSP